MYIYTPQTKVYVRHKLHNFSAIYRLNSYLGSKTPIVIAEYMKFYKLEVTLKDLFIFWYSLEVLSSNLRS